MSAHARARYLRDHEDRQSFTRQTWVDIGSGFGDFGLYLGIHRPDQKFIGYEIVPERIEEGIRVAEEFGFLIASNFGSLT